MWNEVVEALQLSGKIPALGAGGPGSIPGEALFGLFISIRDVNNWNHTTENNERNCVKQIDCTKAYVQ